MVRVLLVIGKTELIRPSVNILAGMMAYDIIFMQSTVVAI